MPSWTGTWEGGRTYQTKDGRTVWVIRKMIDGVRYQRVLDAESKKDAMAELALFERDPVAYRTKNVARKEAKEAAAVARKRDEEQVVYLNLKTLEDFLEGLKDRTERYRLDTQRYLSQWSGKLHQRDLRKVEPREVAKLLSTWKRGKQKRIAALKAFCSFLVKEGQLDPAEDPSRALRVPPSRPEKAIRQKGYSMELIAKVYAAINDQSVRDVLMLHAKLGLHDSEVQRIASGNGVLMAVEHPQIAGTIRFVHKTGRVHTVSADAPTFAAAQRLRKEGTAPSPDRVRWVIGDACRVNEIELPNRRTRRAGPDPKKSKRPSSLNVSELRHSFVSWSLEHGEAVTVSGKGVPLALVASVLGHTSVQTTSRFYDVSTVPAMVQLPLNLRHPDDPEIEQVKPAEAA